MTSTVQGRSEVGPEPAVILARPQLGENIGAAARVMANFGLSDLRVAAPRDPWPNRAAFAMAAGALGFHDAPAGAEAAAPVKASLWPSLDAALGDLGYVLAATARPRELEIPALGPAEAMAALAARRSAGVRAGVVFGPEASGLTNDEIVRADAIVTYPVNPAFSSLNLAQAVGVFAYAWATRSAAEAPFDRAIVPAAKADFEGLMAHVEQALEAAHYFHPAEKQPLMMRHLRAAFARAGLTAQEVRTLRGALKALQRARR